MYGQLLIGSSILTLAFVLLTGCTKDEAPVEDAIETDLADEPAAAPEDESFDDFALTDDPIQTLSMENIFFDYNTAILKPAAREKLAELATQLKTESTKALQLEGHADERGTDEYNLKLGEQRAEAVRRYLVSQGIDESRLSIVSYGESRPVGMTSDEESWSQNRRVEFQTITH